MKIKIFIILIFIIFTFNLSCEKAEKVDYSLGNEDFINDTSDDALKGSGFEKVEPLAGKEDKEINLEMIEEPEEWSFPKNPKEGDMVKDPDGNVWLYSSTRYSSSFEWHISFHSYINN